MVKQPPFEKQNAATWKGCITLYFPAPTSDIPEISHVRTRDCDLASRKSSSNSSWCLRPMEGNGSIRIDRRRNYKKNFRHQMHKILWLQDSIYNVLYFLEYFLFKKLTLESSNDSLRIAVRDFGFNGNQ